jgi:hypothetical protein
LSGRSRRGPASRDIAVRLLSSQRAPERYGGSRRSLLLSIGRDGRGGVAQTDVMCPRCNVPAVLSSAGPGGLNGLSPASVATRPFPFLCRPLVDRLLSRSTPKGVRLARKFSKIRFRFFMRASCTSSGKRDEARPPFCGKYNFRRIFVRDDRSRSAVSSRVIGNGPEQPKETIPWQPRSQL